MNRRDTFVAVIDLATGTIVRLTNTTYDFDPTWSPDGTQIAFVSYRDPQEPQRSNQWYAFSSHIYAMSADGTNQRRLTDGPDRYTNPVWTRIPEKK